MLTPAQLATTWTWFGTGISSIEIPVEEIIKIIEDTTTAAMA